MSIKIKRKLPIYLKDIFKGKRNSVIEMLNMAEHDKKYETQPLFTIEREMVFNKDDEKEFIDLLKKTVWSYINYKIFPESDSFFIYKLNGQNIIRFKSYSTGIVTGTSKYLYFFNASFKNKIKIRIRVEILDYEPEPYKGDDDYYGAISNPNIEDWKNNAKFTKLKFEYKYKEKNRNYTGWFEGCSDFIKVLYENNLYDDFLDRLNKYSVTLERKYLLNS